MVLKSRIATPLGSFVHYGNVEKPWRVDRSYINLFKIYMQYFN